MIEALYRVAPRNPATGRIPAHAETGLRPGLRFLLPPLLVLGLGLGAIALVPDLSLHAWQRGTAMLAAALSAHAPSLSGSTLAPPTSNAPTPPATVPPATALTQPPATAAAPPADTESARMTAEPAPSAPAPPVKALRPPEFSRRAAAHAPAATSSAPSAKKGERREARRTEKAPEPAEPERASKSASPLKASDTDVVVQISVRDLGVAERDVKMLLTRLGGSNLGQDEGSTIAAVPRSSYAEFTRGLAQIGAWRMEAGRSNLPDPVHVAVRLAKPE